MNRVPPAPPLPATSADENARFITDLCDLFARRRQGHVDYWTYGSPQGPDDPVRGDEFWERFVLNHPAYYLPAAEAALIERFAADVARRCAEAVSLVDLGPGSLRAIETKTQPFLRHLPSIKRYVVVDASVHFRDEAARFAQAQGLALELSSEDFWSSLPIQSAPALLLMAGGTISNLCPPLPSTPVDEMLAQALRHFRRSLRGGGWLLFPFDSNQDERSLISAYDHPDFHAFNFSILHRAVRDLPTKGLDPRDFRAGLAWCAARHELQFFVETQRPCHPAIASQQFDLSAHEKFHLVSAYKYEKDLVSRALHSAGFHSIEQHQLPGSPMVLCLARCEPLLGQR
ncbi:hypothetical protein BVG81_005015 [Haliangium sp. UPWRP_2]|nr:hypothetical protein BVG81_005015 [Haliangium sp. UPWRP_2]